jgi:ankyrin repeat protein
MTDEIVHNYQFERLLDAVLNEPEKVPAIVAEDRSILEEENCCGETALHWLAVENNADGVILLRSLGAKISPWAIAHAIEVGSLEVVALLLELGGTPEISVCKNYMSNPFWKLTAKQKRLIRSYFKQYGYEI